jgi:hypothetical protein
MRYIQPFQRWKNDRADFKIHENVAMAMSFVGVQTLVAYGAAEGG